MTKKVLKELTKLLKIPYKRILEKFLVTNILEIIHFKHLHHFK